MVQYLSIIRKSDFIDLFKFGHLYIHQSVAFDGSIEDHVNDECLFNMLTSKMNLFEYSFEYLIIHFNSQVHEDTSVQVEISDVQNIYAFNNEAKKEMSISFDPRIQINLSPWTERFDKLQQCLFVQQSLLGIGNLWTIFDLPQKDRDECCKIITKDIVLEVFRQLYAYERPSGEQSLWTYLLRYERHSLYPKDMKGFFCDFIHVVCNWTSKKECNGDVAEATEAYRNLRGTQFKELSKAVSPKLVSITSEATGCEFHIVAPLFLFLKSVFSEGVDLSRPIKGRSVEEFVSSCKQMGFKFSLATYLLGITLGYDKTYDSFYDVVGLPIFRKKNSKSCELAINRESNNNSKSINDIIKNEDVTSPNQEEWKKEILSYAKVELKVKRCYIKSLEEALEKTGNSMNYNEFFDGLLKFEGWGKSSKSREKLQQHFMLNFRTFDNYSSSQQISLDLFGTENARSNNEKD